MWYEYLILNELINSQIDYYQHQMISLIQIYKNKIDVNVEEIKISKNLC